MKVGVLCIHGFTGGPYEVQPFVDYLKMHTDWLVEVPTLPGHGITLNLANYSAESWMMEAELALKYKRSRPHYRGRLFDGRINRNVPCTSISSQ